MPVNLRIYQDVVPILDRFIDGFRQLKIRQLIRIVDPMDQDYYMNIYNTWDDDVEVFKDASYRYKMTNYVVNNSSELAERMNNMLMMERRFNTKTKV